MIDFDGIVKEISNSNNKDYAISDYAMLFQTMLCNKDYAVFNTNFYIHNFKDGKQFEYNKRKAICVLAQWIQTKQQHEE